MVWKPLERPQGPYTPCLDCGVLIQVDRGSKTGARCWLCRDIRQYDYLASGFHFAGVEHGA